MLFSDSLEVAIGLSFIFLLMSFILTAAREGIEHVIKMRGKRLFEGFVELLGDPKVPERGAELAAQLYRHPMIQGLYRGDFESAKANWKLPSYIPSRNFALALIDQVAAGRVDAVETNATLPLVATQVDRLRFAAERIGNEQLRRALLQAIDQGGDDIEKVQASIEAWFNSAMDRVSGWYKRHSQTIIFWLALVVAIVLNVNTLTIADSLSKNASLRRALAENAGLFVDTQNNATVPASAPAATPPAGTSEAANQSADAGDIDNAAAANATEPANDDAPGNAAVPAPAPGPQLTAVEANTQLSAIEALGLPIGWSAQARADLWRPFPKCRWASDRSAVDAALPICGDYAFWLSFPAMLQLLVGYVITALAIMLGAPFWFDVLNRLMVIRSTVKPHEKSKEEGSNDPQDAKPAVITVNTGDTVASAGTTSASAAAGGAEDDDVFAEDLLPNERPLEGDPPIATQQPTVPAEVEEGQ